MFLSDLVRAMDFSFELDFWRLTSYGKQTKAKVQ